MDFNNILERYSYADDKEIIERIKNSSGENERENRDIINSIVLWKINRQVNVNTELFASLKKLKISTDLFNEKEKEVESIVNGLLETNGIKIAMASTILKMFYPETFPIIDQRAFRELYGKELPTFYGKNANKKYVELYIKYIKDCYSYNEKVCPNIKFEDVDSVRDLLKRIFPDRHVHEFRYTFITRAKECGVNPEVVMIWSGHEFDNDVKTSRVDRGYTTYSDEYLFREASKVRYEL